MYDGSVVSYKNERAIVSHFQTTQLVEMSLQRLRNGESSAVDDLLACARRRLTELARQMLRDFSVVKRWDDENDIFQEVSIRLVPAIVTKSPESPEHFFKLAAKIMRQLLIDLARRYRGSQNHAAHHATQGPVQEGQPNPLEFGQSTWDPQALMQWTAIHETAERLPAELRDVFDLVFYNGLSRGEVQAALKLDLKTIRKRWMLAQIEIQKAIEKTQTEDSPSHDGN